MASLDFPSSPTNGQTYSSAGITWTYDSTYTVWNVTSSGPVGYSGSRGYTGSKGDIGYSGSLGYTGSAGTNGTNGYNGSQGYTGSASTVIGYTGSKGDIGYTGSAGTNGTNGYTGSAGTTGYTGSLGYSGSAATINWMYKTANYTAVNNDGILADTTSASFTVTLPASPATGTYVSIVDVTSTFATNPLTVAGNGQTLQGLTYTSVVLNVTSAKVDLIYEGAYWAVATTSGTRGYTGSSGVGYTGSASTVVGYTGSLGYVGSQGYNGSAGYTGSVGYTGSLGYTGSQGVIGYTGSQGAIGYTGSLGYTGSKGDIGYTGSIPAAITATSLALGGATLGAHNLAVTGTTQLSSSLGIGMTPSNVLDITQNQNGESRISILNSNAGVSAAAELQATNGTHAGVLYQFGTGYTTSGILRQDGTVLSSGSSAGGLTLATFSSSPIYFGVGLAEVARFATTGQFFVGTTGNWSEPRIGSKATGVSNDYNALSGWNSGSAGAAVIARVDNTAAALVDLYYSTAQKGTVKTDGTNIAYNAVGALIFGTNGTTERVRIDTSGILGIGITPSAWGTFNAAQVGLLSMASYTNGDTDISSNLYYNAGWKYIGTGRSVQIKLDSSTGGGDIKFLVDATGGTAGGATAGSEAARIDSSGNLMVGTTSASPTSPTARLTVAGNISTTWGDYFIGTTYGGGGYQLGIQAVTNARELRLETITGDSAGFITFYPGAGTTERARIDTSGNLLVGKTAVGSTGNGVQLLASGFIGSTLAGSTSATDTLNVYSTAASAFRFYVDMGGTIHATSATITAISDRTLKTNIRPLDTGLKEIMGLQPRRFDWINGDGENVVGFVAQEVEEVLPELVTSSKYSVDENGDTVTKKAVKTGDMIPTLVKAIQELTTRLAALENK